MNFLEMILGFIEKIYWGFMITILVFLILIRIMDYLDYKEYFGCKHDWILDYEELEFCYICFNELNEGYIYHPVKHYHCSKCPEIKRVIDVTISIKPLDELERFVQIEKDL